jgi:hypothetical protein
MPTSLPPKMLTPQGATQLTSTAPLRAVLAIARHCLAYALLSTASWAIGIGFFLYNHQIVRRADLLSATSLARFLERNALAVARRKKTRRSEVICDKRR